jgi:hypothetical protein
VGTVIGIGASVASDPNFISSEDPTPYVFLVEAVVKGPLSTGELTVWSARDSASCGLGLPVGSRAGLVIAEDEG